MEAEFNAIISQLSNYELLELFFSTSDRVQQSWTIFVSAFFAYLLCAHFVGKQLAAAEVWIITIVYSLYCFLILNDLVSSYLMGVAISRHLIESTNPLAVYLSAAVYISAWLLSLIFMYRARRKQSGAE